MDRQLVEQVWTRASHACEYCRMPQLLYPARFQIDHIIARQHGGRSELENLALSCYSCNTYKGPNIAGIDPLTQQLVRLFHPRRDNWADHFMWQGPLQFGRTDVGRATVMVLCPNHPDYVAVRTWLIAEGAFPPSTR